VYELSEILLFGIMVKSLSGYVTISVPDDVKRLLEKGKGRRTEEYAYEGRFEGYC